jgi:hypothetical protein
MLYMFDVQSLFVAQRSPSGAPLSGLLARHAVAAEEERVLRPLYEAEEQRRAAATRRAAAAKGKRD